MPLLSIITINYNNQKGLQKTFDSIFNQTYQEFEYIVIDGGSKDGSRELIEKYSDTITYWVSEPDKGIYNAMNKGIINATGEYVLFINSGDELNDNKILGNVVPYLKDNDIITGNLNIISDESNYIGISADNILFTKMFNGTIWHPCSFIKKEAFARTQLYDETLKIVADWKWFLLGIFKHKLTYKKIDFTISKFYLDGISNNKETHSLLMSERESVLKQNFQEHYDDYTELKKLREYNDFNKYVIVKRSNSKLIKKAQTILLHIAKRMSNY
ncbi:glycosyltransferase family 2 protein [Chryseobacterium aquaticum]|uniref:glycosyltransferase family 2 protein n=1 Tax=Chryseobacterium aquaticum TaxID=452084 RepID=UPI003F722D74